MGKVTRAPLRPPNYSLADHAARHERRIGKFIVLCTAAGDRAQIGEALHTSAFLLKCRSGVSVSFIQNQFEENFITTSVDYVFNWARKSAIWPLTFGLARCAIEMIASSTSRFDIARFCAEGFRPSPRQSDLMIVAGTVTLKMAPVLKRIWDQMPDPKWCISMGV